MPAKCIPNILELNWYQRFGDNKKILKIFHDMPTSSSQLQNRSFHVLERTRTAVKWTKMKITRAKHAKLLFLIVKYVNLWRSCRRRRRRRRRGCLSSLWTLNKRNLPMEVKDNNGCKYFRENLRGKQRSHTQHIQQDNRCQIDGQIVLTWANLNYRRN